MSDPPNHAPGPQGADHEAGEIGRRHRTDHDGALPSPFKPQTEQRCHEAAARHQHEDGEQQTANRGNCNEHGDRNAPSGGASTFRVRVVDLDQRAMQRLNGGIEVRDVDDELHVDVANLVLHRNHIDIRVGQRA